MTKLLWMWTAVCLIQCCWYIRKIILLELATRNMCKLADAVIAYGEDLLADDKKDKVQQIVSQVAECLKEMPEDVWKLEDMIPAQLYFELWPYIEREKNIWQMFI